MRLPLSNVMDVHGHVSMDVGRCENPGGGGGTSFNVGAKNLGGEYLVRVQNMMGCALPPVPLFPTSLYKY